MEEYSIVDFLLALADNDEEKQMIRMISKGCSNEEILEKLLEPIKVQQK